MHVRYLCQTYESDFSRFSLIKQKRPFDAKIVGIDQNSNGLPMSTLNFTKVFSYREHVARSSTWGHHFLFLNLILSSIIGFVYLYAAPASSSFLSFGYLLCSWLGQMCFLSCVVYLLVLFPLTFIGNFRIYRVLAVIAAVLFDAFLLFDVKLYLAAKVHLSIPVLHLMFEDLDFSTGLNYNFMLIAVPITIGLQLIAAKLSTRELYKTRHNYFPLVFCSVAFAAFLASHGLSAWADASGYRGITAMRNVYPAHYPLTARSFLANHGLNIDNSMGKDDDSSIHYPLAAVETDESTASYAQIVTVFINGLSYSDLNIEDTPGLIALKQSYQSFENHYLPYSERNDNYFASTFGLPLQYAAAVKANHVYPVVREELFRNEYSIRLIESKDGQEPVLSIPHGLKSFNYTEAKTDLDVFEKARANIQGLSDDRRIALTLSLNSLCKKLSERERRSALKHIDSALSQYIEDLSDSGALNQTLLIITSSEGSPLLQDEKSIFPRQRQHVPMIIIWPNGQRRAVSEDAITSHFDIAATIGREILGISSDSSTYSLGKDMAVPVKRSYITTTSDDSLVLIGDRSVTIYKSNGDAYTENGGNKTAVNPDLEHLIGATRELNRFK